jgi:glycosyltransferase involved in cell wall biosynthesis
LKVLYAAAHGGYAADQVPLGGGAAVCDRLMAEWSLSRPFDVRLLDPRTVLGSAAPSGADLVRFSEREYGRFCRAFERAVTAEVLRHDPACTAVLTNDISEGPDFRLLGERGYRIASIWHVDVVAYIASIYARRWVRPETLVRWHSRVARSPLGRWIPDVAGLVFDKQGECVRHSRALIFPSEEMRGVVERCYPGAASRVHVVPWGTWNGAPAGPVAEEVERVRLEFGIPRAARCVLTLSRISPEKGQHLLLEALLDAERTSQLPELYVLICGGAAYMQGERYLAGLRRLAARLRRVRVLFPGYVTGARKQAMFALADLYVFPSVHESYGLTLMEALAAGLPAVAMESHGARATVRTEFGEIVSSREELRAAVLRLLGDEARRSAMGRAAQAWARPQSFARAADRVAQIVAGQEAART